MNSYVIGILSSLTALIVSVLSAYAAFVVIYGRARRKRLKFFGLTPSDRNIAIRISGFAIGNFVSEDQSLHVVDGDGADVLEYRAALRLASELATGGLLESLSSTFHSIGFRSLPRKLTVDIDVQLDHELPDTNAIVTLGSGISNRLSEDYIRRAGEIELRMVLDEDGNPLTSSNGSKVRDVISMKPHEVVLGNRSELKVGSSEHHRDWAFIQRFRERTDRNVARTVVTCSGLGRGGTVGSATWLTEHWDVVAEYWDDLSKHSPERDSFVIVLSWFTRDFATEPPQSDIAVAWPHDWPEFANSFVGR